jgi:hypothetical protein
MSNIAKMWKAAAPHKRERWKMAREIEAAAAYEVVERDGAWFVVERDNVAAGPFSNSAAWEWIDRHTARQRYGRGY